MATINGTSGHDNAALGGTSLIGTSADDRIYGYDGNDFIDGGAGNDFLYGGAGFDIIKGGKGDDYASNGTGAGSLDGGAGRDWVDFEGNSGGGVFNLAAGAAKLGQFGQFFAMKNFESIQTGGGGDVITGTNGKNSIYSGGGNDVVKAGGGNDIAWTGSGDDSIDGGAGNDQLNGQIGNDTIRGGAGNDTVLGDVGEDDLFGDAGNDRLDGGSGDDTIHGGGGNDTIIGGEGEDSLFGDAGNDVFMLGLGAASINGGSGFDTLNYTQNHKEILAYVPDGMVIQYNGSGIDHFESIEKIIGSIHHDTIAAGATTELHGFGGDDMIRSGSGANKLTGGEGIDTLSYTYSTGAVTVNLGSNSASRGWAKGDKIAGFENLNGSTYADVLTGSAGTNMIRGEDGNDKINGGGGADALFGDGGNDQIKGGSGADFIAGGAGADTLWGGSEADRFVFGLQDSPAAAGQRDVIRDFSQSQGDKLGLEGLGGLSFIGTAAFSAANQVRFQQSGGNTIVEVNTAGNSGAEMAIQLSGNVNLQASDFLL